MKEKKKSQAWFNRIVDAIIRSTNDGIVMCSFGRNEQNSLVFVMNIEHMLSHTQAHILIWSNSQTHRKQFSFIDSLNKPS